jgi:hypothetical protein
MASKIWVEVAQGAGALLTSDGAGISLLAKLGVIAWRRLTLFKMSSMDKISRVAFIALFNSTQS